MRNEYQIEGIIELPIDKPFDEFWDEFIEFIESKNATFGGYFGRSEDVKVE